MVFVKKGVVIPLGSAGEVDDLFNYPSQFLNINGKFYGYYGVYDGSFSREALAISRDGFNFIKKGIVVPLGNAGEIDDINTFAASYLKINNKIYCYYTANDGNNDRIALAISRDGMNFIKKGVVLDIGSTGEVDDTGVLSPSIIIVNNKIYCYYTAYDGNNDRIALAISRDGMNFIKKGVVILLGNAGEVDEHTIYTSSIMNINNKFYCYYSAGDIGGYYRIALAVSNDGLHFIKKGVVVPLGSTGEIDDILLYPNNTIAFNNKIYCYYGAYNAIENFATALAVSEDRM